MAQTAVLVYVDPSLLRRVDDALHSQWLYQSRSHLVRVLMERWIEETSEKLEVEKNTGKLV
jgi:metal-responsive CopG/Arc/MetJ family transcriptional regulator